MVISPPALVHHAFGNNGATNTELGKGARIVGKPSDAFRCVSGSFSILSPHIRACSVPRRPPLQQCYSDMPLPRISNDSARSFDSAASVSPPPSFTHFRNRSVVTNPASRERALPQLPLRIDTLSQRMHNDEVERLAADTQHPTFRSRTESCWTDDSMPLSAGSRPTSPGSVSAHSQRSSCASGNRSPAKRHALRPLSPPIPTIPAQYKALPTLTTTCKPTPPSFRATLLSPVSALYIAQEATEQIVTLHIGGKVIPTTVATLTQQPSHLSQYIKDSLSRLPEALVRPSHSAVASSSGSVYSQPSSPLKDKLQLLTPDSIPTQVIIHSPSSPIAALRSSRASFFDDVPSDEGEMDVEWLPTKHNANATLLAPPLRSPAGLRSVSSSTTFTTHSFLDTTPDEDNGDPFHLQQHNKSFLDLDNQITTNDMESSQPPSLTSSPSSSTYAPIDMGMLRPLDAVAERMATMQQRSMDIMLDRSPEPYEAILHWLREGQLPHALRYSTACPDKAVLADLPTSARNALLPLLLHPVMAQLQALQPEAEYLGMSELLQAVEREVKLLQGLLRVDAPTTPTVSLLKLRGKASPSSPRPRPTHRVHHSESSVGRLASVAEGSDGWI